MAYIGNTPGVSSQRIVDTFIATAGQTTFTTSSGYTPGYVDVYYNGVKLVAGDDFTAATGTTIVLASGAALGDSVEIVAYLPRGLSDGYLKSEADAKYLTIANPSYTGTLTGGTGVVNLGSGQLYKDAGGNVGVGTTSPTQKFEVAGVGSATAMRVYTTGGAAAFYEASAQTGTVVARLQSNVNAAFVGTLSNSDFLFYTNGSERARIDSAGRFGIGTNSPTSPLHVSYDYEGLLRLNRATTTTGAAFIVMSNGGGNYYIGPDSSTGGRGFASGGAAYGLCVTTESAYPILFGTNNTERVRIDSSGNFLLGRTSLISGWNSILTLQGSMLSTDGSTHSRYTPDRISFSGGQFYVLNGSSVGVILTSSSTAWAAQSDETTKDIIEPITNAVTKVSSLRAVIGKYKTDDDGVRRSFLIAQDVQAVLPEAVSSSEDGTLQLRYTETIPLLVAAINEQQVIIEQLKADVQALKEAA